jgi:predicted RNA-binding protein YlxR (DUF448 family)
MKGHIPERTCVGCRRKAPKGQFVRVARAPGGGVSIDPTGRSPGRGAYVCPREGCVRQARKRRALSRALRVEVDEGFYDELLRYVLRLRGPQD